MRGVVRYENDDLDHAVADLDQALKIDPKYVPALIERAYLRQWRNQLDDAIADASMAIELDPRNSYAFVERGVFEYSKKEYDKALGDFQSGHRPGFPGRGDLYCSRDDLAEQARSEEGVCRAQAGPGDRPEAPGRLRRDGLDVHDAGEKRQGTQGPRSGRRDRSPMRRFSWQSGGRLSGHGQIR